MKLNIKIPFFYPHFTPTTPYKPPGVINPYISTCNYYFSLYTELCRYIESKGRLVMNRKIVYTILSTILALQPALYYYISPSSGNVILTQAQSTPKTAKTVPAKAVSKPNFT